MIRFKNVNTLQNQTQDLEIASAVERDIQADGMLAIPAIIDPHVHFRTPGMEYKEDWQTGARAALRGGCTMVFDMPNTKPPTITVDLHTAKRQLIDSQLQSARIPLRYQLFFGADKNHLHEIENIGEGISGIKVFMGCSTGNLVIDDDESLHAVFALAAKKNLLVAVHAEDEQLIRKRQSLYQHRRDYAVHSEIRNIEVACVAVNKAIQLAKQYGTRLYILHVSSVEEIALIKAAKAEQLPVFAETTPHHLFFNTDAYQQLGGKAVVNPPLRDSKHQDALWIAIRDQVIDTIGSDHAPHTLAEKSHEYGTCPSGMPGIEFMLPMLMNAYHEGLLNLENIVSLTSKKAREIFNLSYYEDWVLLDPEHVETISKTHSKCGWSPYFGRSLKGWPTHVVLRNDCYDLREDFASLS